MNAPFVCEVIYPSTDVYMKKLIHVHIKIKNQYSTNTERLRVNMELHELMMVTGYMNTLIEVSGHACLYCLYNAYQIVYMYMLMNIYVWWY